MAGITERKKMFLAFLETPIFFLINSLAPEADKSCITYNAYQSYTCGTEIDISACLPEDFSDSYMYCNLMGTIKMYMLFCFVLFLLSWF